jgi:hypothetical protein
MSNDYKHINCHLMLVCADALHPDQLQRMKNKENGLVPLTESTIDEILKAWKEKLKREIPKHAGYVVFGYDA